MKNELNVKLLKRIQKAIKEEPRRLNMNWWVTTDDEDAPCGTSACIAGYAVILSRIPKQVTTKIWVSVAKRCEHSDFRHDSQKLLGLNGNQATRLFDETNWPEQFSDAYQKTSNRKKKAAIAIKRIDFFIKTKGTDNEDCDEMESQE
jgi:hypothetical protein